MSAIVGLESLLASEDDRAGGEPLDLPLPGPDVGLVEIVEVENERSLGGSVAAEVGDMGVAAELDMNPGRRRLGQVVRHDDGRAAQEGERRGGHPAVAQRDEVRRAAKI